jgi:hypothetical protein
MIRQYGIRFTHEWEKPVAALLDFSLFNRLARFKASRDIGRRWALDNGCWTTGADTPYDLLEKPVYSPSSPVQTGSPAM